MRDVEFSCECGSLKGVLHDASPRNGCHLVCYCKDCRAFARHLGKETALEAGGGSPLVQVLPSNVEITQGHEHIACLRLTPKGLHRWYVSCCNTPLANTVGTPKIPLAGMWRANFQDIDSFGPVVTYGFTKMALPGGPRKDRGLFSMLGGLMKRSLASYLAGTARKSPFFTKDGAPVVAPSVVNDEERTLAYRE